MDTFDKITKELLVEIGITGLTATNLLRNRYHKKYSFDDLALDLVEHGIVLNRSMRPALIDRVIELHRKQFPATSDSETAKNTIRYIADNTPVMNVETGVVELYNENVRRIVNISVDAYLAHNLSGIGSMTELRKFATPGVFRFNPKTAESKYTTVVNELEVTAFNLCSSPPWRSGRPTDTSEMPLNFQLLFQSVFEEASGRNYALEWIYNAVTDRNHTFLCMLGSQGVGKDLMATLIGHGVGIALFEKVDSSVLEDKFNSQLKNARVIFYDELEANDTKSVNRLKQFSNSRISFESKGKDAETIDNYTSGIIANNNLDAIAISPEDRRFSVPAIGQEALYRVFAAHFKVSDEEGRVLVGELAKTLEIGDDGIPHQDVINFYYWLEERFKKTPRIYGPTTPFKGEYFYYICHSAMPLWMQSLVEQCRENYHLKDIPIKEIRKTLPSEDQKMFPRNPRIAKRLFSYRDVGDVVIGELMAASSREAYIALSPSFIKYQEMLTGEKVAARRKRLGTEMNGHGPDDEDEAEETEYDVPEATAPIDLSDYNITYYGGDTPTNGEDLL